MKRDSCAAAVLATAVLAAYFNALGAAFQFDDYNVIVNNAAVYSFGAWLDSMPGIRPLLKLSYALNWSAGSGPFGFHLINIVIHAANALLVYALVHGLRERSDGIGLLPFLAALMFALHPVQTEAVTYVSGRSVSLMALFYLGSVLAYLRGGVSASPRRWVALSVALFAAALGTKETAVTLPAVLLLLDSLGAKRSLGKSLKRQSAHWLVLIGGTLAIAASPTYRHLFDVSFSTRSVFENLLTQVNAIRYLAGQLIMPWRTNADPDLPVLSALTPMLAFQALAIVALVAIGLRSLRPRPLAAFSILWFFLHLLPTNSVLPRLDVANDRQLYLASIGAFAAAAAGLQQLMVRVNRRWLANATVGVLFIGLGFTTVQRNEDYRSDVAFWEDAVGKSPNKPRAFNNLGYVYQQAGRFDEARRAYARAIELDPDYWRARINLDVLGNPAVEGQSGHR